MTNTLTIIAPELEALINAQCENDMGLPDHAYTTVRVGDLRIITTAVLRLAKDYDWTYAHIEAAKKEGPCLTCTDTGTAGEILANGYYDEYPCPACAARRHAAVKAEVRAHIDARRASQDEQWGGLRHDRTHTPADWATYLIYQIGLATNRPDEFAARMIDVAALAIAAYEARTV